MALARTDARSDHAVLDFLVTFFINVVRRKVLAFKNDTKLHQFWGITDGLFPFKLTNKEVFMGGALPMHIRTLISAQYSEGNTTLLAIAAQQGLSYSTVRNIWKRYKTGGPEGLMPRYNHCGPRQPKTDALIYRSALWLKRHHPDWGAALICTLMQQHYQQRTTPSERTLQRWFKSQHLYKPKSIFPPSALKAAEQPIGVHDVWQIDAKEKLHLSSGDKACYLTIVDQYSGCLLKAVVFPLSEHQ